MKPLPLTVFVLALGAYMTARAQTRKPALPEDTITSILSTGCQVVFSPHTSKSSCVAPGGKETSESNPTGRNFPGCPEATARSARGCP